MVANVTCDETQKDKFIEAARGADSDESPDALDRIMGKLDLTKKPDDPDAGPKAPKGKVE